MSLTLRLFWLGLACLITPALRAESTAPAIDATAQSLYQERTPVEIERLVGRIALYPDVLIALMLPASRDPVDIVLAARAVSQDANRTDFTNEDWSDSVQRLARYPDALALLDEDLEWTTELGEVFSRQPADVMDAIQAVRERAQKLGYLGNTKHQVVVVEEQVIRIHPYSWDYVYVPYYNWRRLYYGDYCSPNEIFISFGTRGYAAGYWRGCDCDWRQRRVWISPSVRVVKAHRNPHAYRHPHPSRATYRVDEARRNHEYRREGVRPEDRRNNDGRKSQERVERERRPENRDRSFSDRTSVNRLNREREQTREPHRVEGPRPRERQSTDTSSTSRKVERKEYRVAPVREAAREDRVQVNQNDRVRTAPEVRRNHEHSSSVSKGDSPHAAGGRNRP